LEKKIKERNTERVIAKTEACKGTVEYEKACVAKNLENGVSLLRRGQDLLEIATPLNKENGNTHGGKERTPLFKRKSNLQ